MEKEIWKTIENFSDYECSSLGNVRFKNTLEKVKVKISFNNVDNYYAVTIKGNDRKYKTFYTHVLVCIVFNSKKPKSLNGERWTVNHLDGNKHNNYYKNLEWTTQSLNMIHALKTGLRKDNIPIIVYDKLTNKKQTYYSINYLSKELNIPRNTVYDIITLFQNDFYKDRYKFKVYLGRLGLVVRKSSVFKVYDYIKQEWLYPKSIMQFSFLSGIKHRKIKNLLNTKEEFYIYGYYFKNNLKDDFIPDKNIDGINIDRQKIKLQKVISRKFKNI